MKLNILRKVFLMKYNLKMKNNVYESDNLKDLRDLIQLYKNKYLKLVEKIYTICQKTIDDNLLHISTKNTFIKNKIKKSISI